jgi:OOP family OmpA-OmpF porin
MARSTSTRIRQLGPQGRNVDAEEDGPVSLAVFVMASLVGFLVILAFGVFFGIQAVERDFEARASALLVANGQDEIEVTARGRDLVLTGIADVADRDDPDAFIAETIPTYVADQLRTRGVGEVTADLRYREEVLEARDVTIESEPLEIAWDESGATVRGSLSDQATVDSLVAAPDGAFVELYEEVDAGDLTVLEGVDPERSWLPTIVTLAREMKDYLPAGSIFVDPNGKGLVRVIGDFESRQERADARSSAAEILAAITFDYDPLTLRYVPPEDATPPPPEQQVVELQTNLDDLIEGKVVEFEVDSDVITGSGRALLDEIVVALRQFPDVPVEIGGHTDDRGSDAYNLDLSRRRAEAVLGYLVGAGEDAERFVVVGYGESQPVADNNTSEGQARNRRIEFTALKE